MAIVCLQHRIPTFYEFLQNFAPNSLFVLIFHFKPHAQLMSEMPWTYCPLNTPGSSCLSAFVHAVPSVWAAFPKNITHIFSSGIFLHCQVNQFFPLTDSWILSQDSTKYIVSIQILIYSTCLVNTNSFTHSHLKYPFLIPLRLSIDAIFCMCSLQLIQNYSQLLIIISKSQLLHLPYYAVFIYLILFPFKLRLSQV